MVLSYWGGGLPGSESGLGLSIWAITNSGQHLLPNYHHTLETRGICTDIDRSKLSTPL